MEAEPTRRRHPVRRVVLTLLGLVVLAVIALVVLALPFRGVQGDAEAARTDLEDASDALRAGDLRAAKARVDSARGHVDLARGATHGIGGDVWQWVPVVGGGVSDVRHLVEALDDAIAIAEIGVDVYPQVLGDRATELVTGESVDLDTLDQILTAARQAGRHARDALAAMKQVDGDAPVVGASVASARDAALAEIQPLDERLTSAEPLLDILREVAAEFEKPVLMFSGGKDSIVMMRLAEKAFYPAKIPFPVLQVDTGYDFPEVLETRDNWVNRLGVRLIIASVEEALAKGIVVDDGKTSRNRHQTGTLLNAIEENGFTAAFAGGRRDEEKARAKERVYSHRDEFGQWDPKMQRLELWSLYNGRIHAGEHSRIFPISNWTELDIWDYIGREGIEIPTIYVSHQRRVFERDGMLLSESDHNPTRGNETVEERKRVSPPSAT